MEFFEVVQNCLQIFGIFIRFLDFLIRFLFEIFAKVYEIFSSDMPLEHFSFFTGGVNFRLSLMTYFNAAGLILYQ